MCLIQKTLHIMKNKDTSSHAKGTVTISNGSAPIEISYQEHEQRNGRLLAQLEQHQLDPDQLLELSEQLKLEQDKLAKGRARYARHGQHGRHHARGIRPPTEQG